MKLNTHRAFNSQNRNNFFQTLKRSYDKKKVQNKKSLKFISTKNKKITDL